MRKRKRKVARRPLTDQQKQLAQLYFDGHSVNEAAAIFGVHRCTIWRWSKHPDFQKEISRIHDKYCREYRRERMKAWHNSPEYKKEQQRKYYARQRLDILAKRLSEAGNSGHMKEYRRISAEYDKCFNEAYFGGKTAAEFLKFSRILTGTEKASKPKKYIVEIIP